MPLNQAPATAIPRPLGTLEKLFWLADQNRPTHFAIIAEVGGSTRRACLHAGTVWINPASCRRERHVRVDRPCRQPARSAFDTSSAPLLRATLLHGADRSVIILCVHHSIADGLALSFLMRDVLRAFAGQPVRLSTETASVEHLVAQAQYLGDARGGSNSYSKAADAVPATGRVNTAGGGRASHAGDDAIPARAGAG